MGTRPPARRESVSGLELNGQIPETGHFDGDGATEGRVLRYGDEVRTLRKSMHVIYVFYVILSCYLI